MGTKIKDSVSPRFPSARPPPSPTSSALPIKAPQPHHRNPSLGSVNSHRVTRRKSMSLTSGAIMAAAVVAAVKEAAEIPFSLPVKSAGVVGLARSPGRSNGKNGAGGFTSGESNGYPSPPSSLPTQQGSFSTNGAVGPVGGTAQNLQFPRKTGSLENGGGDSAIAEGYGPEVKGLGRRRASEGAHTVPGGTPEGSTPGRGSRARSGSELKCEKCGKGYKHSSCLTKHLFVLPSSIYLFFPGFARTRITFYFSYPTLCISELFISSSRILARYLPFFFLSSFFNSTLRERERSRIYTLPFFTWQSLTPEPILSFPLGFTEHLRVAKPRFTYVNT